MKFIKYAVGLVIALSVIPLVVVTVNNLDTPKLKTVEFEVVDYDEGNGLITFSDNTYNDIYSLAILDDNNYVANLITVKVNDTEVIVVSLEYNVNISKYFFLSDGESYDWDELDVDNIALSSGYVTTIGDKWTMTFEVSLMSPLVKLLVGFVPLIFVGGILLFMLNKRKKEE